MRDRIHQRVRLLISGVLGVASKHVEPDTNLNRELGVDSLDKIELAMQLEEKFGVDISDADALEIKTVRDVARLVEESETNP